ncbi:MAG: hypothetical protein RL329_3420 [Bacteroidota bacterium]|jgi:hypothetical protein
MKKKTTQFINPFTDLEEVPEMFQQGILSKIFKVADMANLTREDEWKKKKK